MICMVAGHLYEGAAMDQLEQLQTAQHLLDGMGADGVEAGFSALTLLDHMATLGVEFALGAGASDAYLDELRKRVNGGW